MQAMIDKFGLTHFRFVERANAEHTIVFLNSLGSDLRIWDKVLAHGIGNNSTLTLDMRGHGLSDLGEPPYTIEQLATDVKELLDELSISKVVLCGVSVGGLVAQQFYATWPQRVEGLILSNTADRIGDQQSWQNRIDLVEQQGLAPIADQILNNWFSPQFQQQHPGSYRDCANMFTRTNPAGYIGVCHTLKHADLTPLTSDILVPTICIAGGADKATYPDLVHRFSKKISTAKYELLEGVGHIPCIEAPERVAQIIHDLLATIKGNYMDKNVMSRLQTGMMTRRKVLGDAHVDMMQANETEFDAPFQQLITEAAWGHVWSRPGLNLRERSMVTIALLAALGHDEEVKMHVRATRNTGATKQDICEVLLHVSLYAGIPAANRAITLVKETYAEMEQGKDHEAD